MRVAVIIDGLTRGGAERQAVVTAGALMQAGHDVALICYGKGDAYLEQIRRLGIEFIRIEARGIFRIRRLYALCRVFRSGRFDVVYSFKSSSSIYGNLAGRLAGVPCIQSSCRGFFWFGPMPRRIRAKKYPGWYASERVLDLIPLMVNRLLTRGTAGWTVNSRKMRLFAHLQFGVPREHLHVVYNGVLEEDCVSQKSAAEAKSLLGLDPERSTVACIGSLRPVKNQQMLLRAVDRLRQAGGTMPLILLVGDGPTRPRLEAEVRRLGMEDFVRFLGDRSNIPDILRATDVVVSTSISEGLPNVLIEAAMSGLPCVATRSGGAEDIVVDGESGYLVGVDDDVAMANCLGRIIGDERLRAQMASRARELAMTRFSTGGLAQRLEQIWSRYLASRGRSVEDTRGPSTDPGVTAGLHP